MPTRTIGRRRARAEEPDEFDQEDGYTPGGEDEEEDRPRRGRRAAREEAPAPRRGRRPARSEEPDEDEEDEAPRRSRRAARSEEPDDDEPPRRGRRSRAAEEEEAPRRGRRAARSEEPDEDEDEDEAPRGRSRRSSRGEEEPSRPRYKTLASKDAEDERPKGRRSTRDAARAGALKGWDAYGTTKAKSSTFPDTFKPNTEQVLILFLDDEPFATYREHWVEEIQGRKSRTCLEDDCPLCEIGHQPRVRVCFNIVDWTKTDKPVLKVWEIGVRLAETIKNFSEQPKTSPINKPDLYWSVFRTGTKSKTEYHFAPVKERDLDEDWDRDPLSEADITALGEGWDPAYVKIDSHKELAEVADQLDSD